MAEITFDMILSLLDAFLQGLSVTLHLGFLSILIGMILGLAFAIGQVFGGKQMSRGIIAFVEFIRGLPVIVVIFIVFLGIATIIDMEGFTAALIALSIRSAAFQTTVFAGGFQSVESGQMIAAQALGFTKLESIQHVIFPQAFRFSIPSWANIGIATIKDTSLGFYVGVRDLMNRAMEKTITTFQPLLCYGLAAVLYIIVILCFARLLKFIEKRTKLPGFGGID